MFKKKRLAGFYPSSILKTKKKRKISKYNYLQIVE